MVGGVDFWLFFDLKLNFDWQKNNSKIKVVKTFFFIFMFFWVEMRFWAPKSEKVTK
jgi:hypothetical protein